jgi:hypothetical protein
VKTINIAEKDGLHQTDTGPVIVPDLSADRVAAADPFIGVFDLAYSAWHAPDWAEVVCNVRTSLSADISVNHYSRPRLLAPTQNCLLLLP